MSLDNSVIVEEFLALSAALAADTVGELAIRCGCKSKSIKKESQLGKL